MRKLVAILLIFSCNLFCQEQPELDEKYVNTSIEIDYNKSPEVTSWGDDDTFSSLLHLKERIENNNNPIFIFVIDGGDLFEAENLAKFLNSPEGRSFRIIANYFVLDSRTLPKSKTLKKIISPDANMFLMSREMDVLAQSKINFYQTKTGADWWDKIKKFIALNKNAVEKVTEHMRAATDHQLIKRFDGALDKIKNASFRERRKAIKTMKSMVAEVGFLLLPTTTSKDPEASRTAEKLLLENQTRLNFPVTKKLPSWFNFEKQVSFLSK